MSPPPISESDLQRRLRWAVEAALDKKADELVVLHLEPVCDFTDYFVVCSGNSDRQVKAIAEAIDSCLREHGERPIHLEGFRESKWVLLDYGDFVVHVFDRDRREFYRLERLWDDAEDVTDRLVA